MSYRGVETSELRDDAVVSKPMTDEAFHAVSHHELANSMN